MSAAPLYIGPELVLKYLDLKELMQSLEEAFAKFSEGPEGGVVQPVRVKTTIEDRGMMLDMPAYSRHHQALATKVVTVFPKNTDMPSHHAVILMFNHQNGSIKAIMDGEEITKYRTAAASGVATKYLACPDPKILAIIGCGVQGESHLEIMQLMYKFQQVNVYNRTPSRAQKLADKYGAQVCSSVEEAVKDADIICTLTGPSTPILMREWVKHGAHINAVGAPTPVLSELDPSLMHSAVVYADTLEGAYKESGDVIKSKCEIYAEIGEVVLGRKQAKREETTIFKSLGMAVEDVVASKLVYDKYMADQSS